MSPKKPFPTHEDIALCAYYIYEQEGCPDGRAHEHWLQAEIQLLACSKHEEWTQKSETTRDGNSRSK